MGHATTADRVESIGNAPKVSRIFQARDFLSTRAKRLTVENNDSPPPRFLICVWLLQDKLLSVQGASATSVCLTACTAAMHDADSLIDFAISEMDRSIDKSTADTTQGSQFDATSFRHRPP